MSNIIYDYVDETSIYYFIALSVFLLFLYVMYTTYSIQMNVIEGLTVDREKRLQKEDEEN